MTLTYLEFEGWLNLELYVFISYIVANAVYLFFRALFAQRTHLKIGQMLQGETCDFLESQQILGGIFTSFVTPVFISLALALYFPTENAAGHRIVDF
jgi:hypothetical protein